MRLLGLPFLLMMTACSMPSRDSEEFKFNRMLQEQRAQCRQLPEPLSTSCLVDVNAKSYEEYLKHKSN